MVGGCYVIILLAVLGMAAVIPWWVALGLIILYYIVDSR